MEERENTVPHTVLLLVVSNLTQIHSVALALVLSLPDFPHFITLGEKVSNNIVEGNNSKLLVLIGRLRRGL